MKILLVEDDKPLSMVMKKGLEQSGYAVDWVKDGPSSLEMAEVYSYDVIILDIVLPGIDGFEVAVKLRERKIRSPILMLTARYQEADRVRGLDSGADDYLVKPFSYPELYARIRALIRRATRTETNRIVIGPLVLDSTFRTVTYNGLLIALTSKEYSILEYLIINRNGIVTREMLEEHLWDSEHGTFSNVIDVLLSRIRRKLCPEDKEAIIHTVKGLGYVVKNEKP
jgi:DNA-binding response OmpR family regulator